MRTQQLAHQTYKTCNTKLYTYLGRDRCTHTHINTQTASVAALTASTAISKHTFTGSLSCNIELVYTHNHVMFTLVPTHSCIYTDSTSSTSSIKSSSSTTTTTTKRVQASAGSIKTSTSSSYRPCCRCVCMCVCGILSVLLRVCMCVCMCAYICVKMRLRGLFLVPRNVGQTPANAHL